MIDTDRASSCAVPIHKVVVTYVKTSGPHCAMAVKSLGEKSRAGLTAKPELNPNEAPITIRSKPMAIGFSPTLSRGFEFLESVMAKIPSKRRNVPITYGRSITIIIMSTDRVSLMASSKTLL